MTKVCPGCKIEKPYDEFYKSNKLKKGIQPYCKICSNKTNKRVRDNWKENGPTIFRADKECQKCHNRKPISQFGTRRDSADGKLSYCKPCWVIITTNAQKKRFDKTKQN